MAHRPTFPSSQPDMPTRVPVSQHVPSTQHQNKHSARTVKLRPQDERTTFGIQCAYNTRRLSPRHFARNQQCLARARMSRTPTGRTHSSRRITQCCRSSKSPSLATHSGEHRRLFHGPTVAVRHSVTGIPHCRPSAPNVLQLTVFRFSKTIDEWPAASTSTQLAIPLSTQPIMPSVDNVRRESHPRRRTSLDHPRHKRHACQPSVIRTETPSFWHR